MQPTSIRLSPDEYERAVCDALAMTEHIENNPRRDRESFIDREREFDHRMSARAAEIAVARDLGGDVLPITAGADPGWDVRVGVGLTIQVKSTSAFGYRFLIGRSKACRDPHLDPETALRALTAHLYVLVWPDADDPRRFHGVGYLDRFEVRQHHEISTERPTGIIVPTAAFHSWRNLRERAAMAKTPPVGPVKVKEQPNCNDLPYASKCRQCKAASDHAGVSPLRCAVCGESTPAGLVGYCTAHAEIAPLVTLADTVTAHNPALDPLVGYLEAADAARVARGWRSFGETDADPEPERKRTTRGPGSPSRPMFDLAERG